MRKMMLAAAGVIALAACSGQDEAAVPAEDTSADTPAVPTDGADAETAATDQTTGGDGSEIVLSPMNRDDIASVTLEGELGCSFSAGGGPLLVAMGWSGVDEPAQAAVKLGDYVEKLTATTSDGFGGLLRGTGFSGKGLTIEIDPTSEDRVAHEGSEQAATLTAMRGDGAERRWDGTWTCGP